jgi:BirA family biotin operon repressor/biotin-[acetyl-CoA-carboxylase] ligase
MKSPFNNGRGWVQLDSVESTQRVAADFLKRGEPVAGILATHQTHGTGRFGRPWFSKEGDSLTVSFIFWDYADHPKPYLVSMALAIAAAGVLHTQLQWPNDLVIGTKKVAGVLAELLPDGDGRRIPVVGIGVNMNQKEFPEDISDRATSLHLEHGKVYDAKTIAEQIIHRFESLPEPTEWSALAPIWDLFDKTPGKRYLLPSGELAIGLGVGSDGQLLCSVDGESKIVLAADALFGASA